MHQPVRVDQRQDGVLPAEDEKAVFAHYDLNYQPGVAGERRLARR
ncbi:hypothetical protein ACWDRX_20360 [Streptomyces nigra]